MRAFCSFGWYGAAGPSTTVSRAREGRPLTARTQWNAVMLRSLFKPDAKLGSLHPSGSFNVSPLPRALSSTRRSAARNPKRTKNRSQDFSLGYENVVEQIGEETTGSSLNVLTSGSSRRAPK